MATHRLTWAAALVAVCVCLSLPKSLAADPAIESKKTEASSTSNIIPSVGAAELWSGNGDVSATGACAPDIKAFCKDVGAGEGRVAACLTKRTRAQKQGNVVGRKVSDKCLEDLTKFKMDRSSNLNKNAPLARACKEDVGKHCKDSSDVKSPGSTILCLKNKMSKLNANCKAEVFKSQQEMTDDFRMNYKLYEACKADFTNMCADVEPGEGREIECLESKVNLSWECRAQIVQADKELGSDLRLSTRLFHKCLTDYKKFCKDVEPGNMAAQECLEDHSDDADFSPECKEELENMIAKRVSDFRLNTALREACEVDLRDTCGSTLEAMDADEKVKQTALNCLQQYKEELKEEKCKAEVRRRMSRAARDIRFDEVLANACYEDRGRFCSDVQPGSARVIRCLQDNRNSLAPKCAAALFDHEVRMAEDIDFKYPMKKACAWEISNFCKNVPHGHARIIRCLQEHLEDSAMSKECKDETVKDMNRMAGDYRLNWRLNHACESDINKLCRNVCSTSGQVCGGLVLQCLQDKQENITSQACQDEVFYYELMEVTDFRNDVILAEACRDDVDKYCKDIEPGEGRVHACLRFNSQLISDRCRKEENKLQAIEYRDIRLRPKLNKLCSEERAVYCHNVKPGKARVIKCLMENMAQPNFGEDCKNELQEREHLMQSDYRYDFGVFTTCSNDVEMYCKEAQGKLRGNATVLKCLIENFKGISEGCQSEMSRAVRLALWDYKPGAALTASCDLDVQNQCPMKARSPRSGAVFTIGVVGRCLSKALVEGKSLGGKCRELVLVAAPKDARSYFENPESSNAVVQMISQMQKAAGLDAVLVNPHAGDGSTVTVTGWVALACILSLIIVVIGGVFVLYKRVIGADKPHTLHVKMGDA